jgi:hypothetical protein
MGKKKTKVLIVNGLREVSFGGMGVLGGEFFLFKWSKVGKSGIESLHRLYLLVTDFPPKSPPPTSTNAMGSASHVLKKFPMVKNKTLYNLLRFGLKDLIII